MYDETLKNIPRLGSIIFMKMRLTFKEIRQCDFYYCASYDTSLDFFDPLETAWFIYPSTMRHIDSPILNLHMKLIYELVS